jgi:hypothetical protein
MSLNIKNPEVERLTVEVTSRTAESKTEAVGQALRERLDRLNRKAEAESGDLTRFLEAEIWPLLPREQLDRPGLSKAERCESVNRGQVER